MMGVTGGTGLCLALWLATLGHALDLDEVHNLCQPREFHSFRRKVCSISKRSVDAGEYASFLRESGTRMRRGVGAVAPLTLALRTPAGAGSGGRQGRQKRSLCYGGVCRSSQKPALEAPHDTFYDNELLYKVFSPQPSSNNAELGRYQAGDKLQQDSKNVKIDPQLLSTSPLLQSLGLSLSQGREDESISADTLSMRNQDSYLTLLPESRWNNVEEQRDNAIRSILHNIVAFRLTATEAPLNGNSSTVVNHFSSWADSDATRYAYEIAAQDGETLLELSNPSTGGPPIGDHGEAVFEPSDVIALSTVEEEPERSYGHWDRDDEFVLLGQKPRRNGGDAGPTVGMLREHCCLYGCTLNRHFHHFLSTCSSGP